MTGDEIAYHQRAEECRTMAANFPDPETRRQVLHIADEYDRLAMQAATLEIQLQELAASQLMQHKRER
jgi:hypothetical protein